MWASMKIMVMTMINILYLFCGVFDYFDDYDDDDDDDGGDDDDD